MRRSKVIHVMDAVYFETLYVCILCAEPTNMNEYAPCHRYLRMRPWYSLWYKSESVNRPSVCCKTISMNANEVLSVYPFVSYTFAHSTTSNAHMTRMRVDGKILCLVSICEIDCDDKTHQMT